MTIENNVNDFAMMIFENNEFGKIEVINYNNEPHFIAKDIAEILEYSETSTMLRRLDDDEKIKIVATSIAGANNMARELTIISESGLYNAILGSHKTEAKKFKKWVTSEVIPSIRKHGGYLPHQESPEELLSRAVTMANSIIQERNLQVNEYVMKLEQAKPMIEFAEQVSESLDAVELGVFAKAINDENIPLGRNKLFEWLRNNGYLMENNLPYQKYIDNNFFEVVEKTYHTIFGDRVYFQTYIKGKGQIAIVNKLRKSLLN